MTVESALEVVKKIFYTVPYSYCHMHTYCNLFHQ